MKHTKKDDKEIPTHKKCLKTESTANKEECIIARDMSFISCQKCIYPNCCTDCEFTDGCVKLQNKIYKVIYEPKNETR